MSLKKYCELLMRFRDRGVRFSSYMGTRWFASKVIMIIAVVVMLSTSEPVSHAIGFIIIGYLVGVIAANIQGYIQVKAKWQLQRDLIDWNKVEEHLKGTG